MPNNPSTDPLNTATDLSKLKYDILASVLYYLSNFLNFNSNLHRNRNPSNPQLAEWLKKASQNVRLASLDLARAYDLTGPYKKDL